MTASGAKWSFIADLLGVPEDERAALTCPALFVPSELIEIGLERSLNMAKKRPTLEQIVTLLRQIEVTTSRANRCRLRAVKPGYRTRVTIAGARNVAGLIWTKPGG